MADFEDAEMLREKAMMLFQEGEKLIARAEEAKDEAVKLELIEVAENYFAEAEEMFAHVKAMLG